MTQQEIKTVQAYLDKQFKKISTLFYYLIAMALTGVLVSIVGIAIQNLFNVTF